MVISVSGRGAETMWQMDDAAVHIKKQALQYQETIKHRPF